MATGITRNGKPIQIGDFVTIVGTVTAVTGSGGAANITVLCQGALEGATDPTQNTYSYSIGVPLAGGTNAPATGVYAADTASAQTL
jgi:hypothetical protein